MATKLFLHNFMLGNHIDIYETSIIKNYLNEIKY